MNYKEQEELFEDVKKLIKEGNIFKASKKVESLIKRLLNFQEQISSEDLELINTYYKCVVLLENPSFKISTDHNIYKWLEADPDAEYLRRYKKVYCENKLMSFYYWDFLLSDTTHKCFFNFGKYEGEHLQKIAKRDFQYIFWCYTNIPSFFIVDLIRFDEEIRKKSYYQKLIKTHLIKADFFGYSEIHYIEEDHKQYISLGDALGQGEANIAYWNTH